MIDWYPAATKDQMGDAGAYVGGPYRGVLHTTEGTSYIGAKQAYLKNGSNPHFTVEGKKVWQHVPLSKAARAMKNLPGGVETNRLSAIQIEVVGFARTPDWSLDTIETVRKLMIWIEEQTGIKPSAPRFLSDKDGWIARLDAPQRMAANAWKTWDGWCGHQHVPENTHWDPGTCPITALLIRSPLTPENPKPVGAPMANAPFVTLLQFGEGYLQVGADGGVFAWEAPFFGSLGGVPLNAHIVDACWTPTRMGYWMVGADGGVFPFGDAVFHGSMGDVKLNQPVTSISATEEGGYILGAKDGGVFPFGPGAAHRGNALWAG